MLKSLLIFILASALPLTAIADESANFRVVEISNVPSYANAKTVIRRLTSGLVYAHYEMSAQQRRVNLELFTFDPKDYQWRLLEPANSSKPAGLLLWLPDDDSAGIPPDLAEAARASNIAIMSATGSGSDEDIIMRRAPLALTALHWFNRNYSLDSTRILIGGQRDSAVHAEAMALGFADIFTGAVLLDGGAELGSRELSVPLKPLLELAQQRVRYVFVSTPGEQDVVARSAAASLERYCITGSSVMTEERESLSPAILARALATASSPVQPSNHETCNLSLNNRIARVSKDIDTAISASNWKSARESIVKLNIEYGGLAEKQILESADLMQKYYEDFISKSAEFVAPFERDMRVQGVKPIMSPGT